uniref:Ubiquinone biosynthesis O-methyltransferase, mitochondrial n=1 Tax=Opuntia streptacantha TaxID=393608 RepID=A0A7C9ECC5_OPUST
MAARMLTRLRALRTAGDETSHQLLNPSQGRKNLLPIALAFSSWAFDFRCYSNATRPRSSEPSSRKETPVSLNEARTCSICGDRVSMRSSLDPAELARFSAIAETWWDAEGPYKPLHALNPTRLAFIRSTLCHHFRKDPNSPRPFEGLRFVDVGCGGGLLSEPLARMGAMVTGVDAVDQNIKIARLHAESDPVTASIEYLCTTAEKLVEEQRQFDAVLALEVIEHVADPAEFCQSLAELTIPNGAIVISTINRTMRAYAAAIVGAEYILRWLPRGTHEWSKFVTPEELALLLKRASVTVQEMAGFVYKPLSGKWVLSDDISVNYIAFATKDAH